MMAGVSSWYDSRCCPSGLTFTWWGCCGFCFWHKPTELAHSFLFGSCVYFSIYGPFNCISFQKFSRQLSAFSLCCPGLISALLVLSINYLLLKVSFSCHITLCRWLGLKNQLTNSFLKRTCSLGLCRTVSSDLRLRYSTTTLIFLIFFHF